MKILEIIGLPLDGVKILKFERFRDERGYFSSVLRLGDLAKAPFLSGFRVSESADSRSRAGTVRGLHFQWNPNQGKLVRTVSGHMVDILLDLRRKSPTLGRVILYSMPADDQRDWDEWIWIPPGFAHGNFYAQDSLITYLIDGQYNPACEAGISPWAPDLDWSLAETGLKNEFDGLSRRGCIASEKDLNGLSLSAWLMDKRAESCGF